MSIPIETFFLDPDAEGTLQGRIQQMIAEGILSGRFQKNEKLPSRGALRRIWALAALPLHWPIPNYWPMNT